MAEQALNTIYTLGDQPDALCTDILKELTNRVFGSTSGKQSTVEPEEREGTQVPENSMKEGSQAPTTGPAEYASAFQLAQLLFTAGHVAVKHILHLEHIEREFKNAKEKEKKDKSKTTATEELDQVVGSVEDDIADSIAHAKEKELLYGPDSLLAIFGPMAVEICRHHKVYTVRQSPQ